LAEQNLFIQSQQIGASGWGLVNVTTTLNTTVAPDGTTTASTVTGTGGASALRYLSQGSLSATSSIGKTISIYAKAGTNNFIQFYYGGDGNAYANFDISTGVLGTVGSNATASITASTNGFYRCVINTTSATATDPYIALITTSTSARAESNTLATTYFAWGFQLEFRPIVTAYNPTTTTAITNYIPQLMTAAINAARFDYNPTTRAALGLLIEQSSTNLLTYSQDFTNAIWTKPNLNGTLTTASNIAPDGTQTVILWQENNTATVQKSFYQSVSVTSGTSYTFSMYAKQYSSGSKRWLSLYPQSSATAAAVFDLLLGTVTFTSGANYVSSSITLLGNGMYRCTITFTAASTGSAFCNAYISNSGTAAAPAYTGDGFSGIYIWGAQTEALAFATSYIPTTTAQVTRAVDDAYMTGTNFSSWYNPTQGSIYANFSLLAAPLGTGNKGIYCFFLNGSNAILSYASNSAGVLYDQVVAAGAAGFNDGSASALLANTQYKDILAYATNNTARSINASTPTTATSCNIPSGITTFRIGQDDSSSRLNGYLKNITYYPTRLTNAQLKTLTT
jgi:hypothetical protein